MEPLRVAVPGLAGIVIGHPYMKLSSGFLTIRKGYAWDGASGVPDNPDNMRASLFHDALYQLMRLGLLDRKYKDVADRLFRQICLQDGMKKNWADFMYNGLKALGEGATKPDKHPKGTIIEIKYNRRLNAQ